MSDQVDSEENNSSINDYENNSPSSENNSTNFDNNSASSENNYNSSNNNSELEQKVFEPSSPDFPPNNDQPKQFEPTSPDFPPYSPSNAIPKAFDAYEQPIGATQAREIAMDLIHSYFTTHQNPLVKHHIDSYDQFLSIDLKNIIASQNPILILNNPKSVRESGSEVKSYKYKTEIYIGGESGSEIYIGTPMISLAKTDDTRLLFPNEARLRNLTYAIQVQANIFVRVTIKDQPQEDKTLKDTVHEVLIEKYHLFNVIKSL